jgi:hypothetical protein
MGPKRLIPSFRLPLNSSAMVPNRNSLRGWCVGAIASLAFIGMSIVKLDAQGMYYDEIHQAPASFFYIGEKPAMFVVTVRGFPVMNMSYSGAIKSALYGLYLRYGGGHFTVYSWRLLGILLTTAGLLLFYKTGGEWLPATSTILFALLLLADTSVLLMTRHDWGPVALSLSLRLAFLGLLIRMAWRPSWSGFFIAGVIIGIVLFEKLSGIVLLIPFCMFLWEARKRFLHGALAGVLGFAIGCLPLALVNAASFVRGAGLISLSNVQTVRTFHIQEALDYGRAYFSVGQGVDVRDLILGDHSSGSPQVELVLVLALTCLVFIAAGGTSNTWLRLARLCAASYILIGVALFLMPQVTSLHHWILGTPFQYAAIVLALAGFAEESEQRTRRTWQIAMIALAIALIVVRIPTVVAVEQSLGSGKAADRFDPEFTRVAELSVARAADAVFVSGDWGTATQLYCIGNGRPDMVFEPFWSNDPAAAVLDIASRTTKATMYVLVTGIAPQFAKASESILDAMRNAPGWEEVPVEKEFAGLARIRVRKFGRHA